MWAELNLLEQSGNHFKKINYRNRLGAADDLCNKLTPNIQEG